MLENILHEPILSHDYYREYLTFVKKYENISRTGIYMRYYNINSNVSIYADGTHGTEDKHLSGIYFDIYDYTPAFNIGNNLNSVAERNDLSGFKFDGGFEITLYTITEPKIGDIVIFPYEPNRSEEIFRVKDVSTSLNSRNYNIYHYKLTLEYAPLKTVSELKIANNYVYLSSKEKNILAHDYKTLVVQLKEISNIIQSLQLFFNEKYELYYCYVDDKIFIPIGLNRILYNKICKEIDNNRYFDKFKKPYGVLNYTDDIIIDLVSGKIVLSQNNIPYITSDGIFATIADPNISLIDFNSIINKNIDLYILCNLLSSFIGFNI